MGSLLILRIRFFSCQGPVIQTVLSDVSVSSNGPDTFYVRFDSILKTAFLFSYAAFQTILWHTVVFAANSVVIIHTSNHLKYFYMDLSNKENKNDPKFMSGEYMYDETTHFDDNKKICTTGTTIIVVCCSELLH
jgi:hypothetical protein